MVGDRADSCSSCRDNPAGSVLFSALGQPAVADSEVDTGAAALKRRSLRRCDHWHRLRLVSCSCQQKRWPIPLRRRRCRL